MYRARSLKNYGTVSKIARLLSSSYKRSIDKGLKLYNEIAKEIIKVKVILYRKQAYHELQNPDRTHTYHNKLLPDYKAYWTGHLSVLAQRDDVIKYFDKVIKKPEPGASDIDIHKWDKLNSILETAPDYDKFRKHSYTGRGGRCYFIAKLSCPAKC